MNPGNWSLRTLVAVDAATCAAMAIALALFGETLSAHLLLPRGLLLGAAAVLITVAAFMATIAAYRVVPMQAARIVVVGNVAWIIASIAVLASSLVEPGPLGILFVVAQALFVAGLTALEHRALGRARSMVRVSG